MKAIGYSCRALGIGLAAALLTACGGSPVRNGVANNIGGASSSSGSKTFAYTGKKQSFVVPAGVTQLAVVVLGAAGGDVGFRGSPSWVGPSLGGRVDATIPVQPGEKLYVFVGGRGQGTAGGFNGGGNGVMGGDGGGGASDIRQGGDALDDRVIVAAGSGGSGAQNIYTYGWGGNGGGFRGRPGGGGGSARCDVSGTGGRGGTQHRGGSGGAGGTGATKGTDGERGGNGTPGNGGNGGASPENPTGSTGGGGGGGGGGYRGGGGGGGGASSYGSDCGSWGDLVGGGGGGGSSYFEPGATHRRIWTGDKKARRDGLVIINW